MMGRELEDALAHTAALEAEIENLTAHNRRCEDENKRLRAALAIRHIEGCAAIDCEPPHECDCGAVQSPPAVICPFCKQHVSETRCNEQNHKDCICWIEVQPLSVDPKSPPPLTADCTRLLPGGKLDDSTYEQIERALDRANAPNVSSNGHWLTLTERVLALRIDPQSGDRNGS